MWLSRNKGQTPWPHSRSQSNQQELLGDRALSLGRTRWLSWIHSPSPFKACGTWFLVLLFPPSNYFSIYYLCQYPGGRYFLMCTCEQSVDFHPISPCCSKMKQNVATLLKGAFPWTSRVCVLPLPLSPNAKGSGGIPVMLDWNTEWIFPQKNEFDELVQSDVLYIFQVI